MLDEAEVVGKLLWESNSQIPFWSASTTRWLAQLLEECLCLMETTVLRKLH